MTAIKFVPIEREAAMRLLALLHAGRLEPRYMDVSEVNALSRLIGEAISIAGEHVSAAESLCAELLELIGRVSGRSLSTIPGDGSLAAAEEALSDLAPMLGKVLHLPRAANTDTKALDAAVARGLADMPGPISLRVWTPTPEADRFDHGEYTEADPVDVWAVPRERETWGGHRIVSIEWDSPTSVRMFLAALAPEVDP
jgi:hypothetical protein